MGKIRSLLIVFAVGLVGAACASRSADVAGVYISPLSYERYSCAQIAEEAQRVSVRVAHMSGVQDERRSSDVVMTTAGVILFWPALFFVSGDGAQTAELARLKGEFDALQQVSIRKNCGLEFRAIEPVAPPRPPMQAPEGFPATAS